MNIRSSRFFISAYQTRLMERFKTLDFSSAGVRADIAKRINEAVSGLKNKRGENAVIVTMTDEAKRYLQSEELIQQVEKDTAELFINSAADPDDVFSFRANDQWAVFSEYLNNNGFYDGLSDEEVMRREALLMRITDGLDSLSQSGADWYSEVTKQLDSAEANLELVSSTAALAYFNEKYVAPDMQDGFNALIDSYYKHNAKATAGYRSMEERFNEARAKLPESTQKRLRSERLKVLKGARLHEAEQEWAIRDYLGRLSHTDEETFKHNRIYTELFESLKGGLDFDIAMEQLKSSFLEFATGGSSEQSVHDFIENSASSTFERIRGYWKTLLEA